MEEEKKKILDIIQALSVFGLMVIALFSFLYAADEYENYKAQGRASVGVARVEIGSNLTMGYPIGHPGLGKDVPSGTILEGNRELQDTLEEIIVTVGLINSGRAEARDIAINVRIVAGDAFTLDGKPNEKSIFHDLTDFNHVYSPDKTIEERKLRLVSLLPQQEKKEIFVFPRKHLADRRNIMQHDTESTNAMYLACNISYKSLNGGKHQYHCVYKLYHLSSHTRLYAATLIKSYAK